MLRSSFLLLAFVAASVVSTVAQAELFFRVDGVDVPVPAPLESQWESALAKEHWPTVTGTTVHGNLKGFVVRRFDIFATEDGKQFVKITWLVDGKCRTQLKPVSRLDDKELSLLTAIFRQPLDTIIGTKTADVVFCEFTGTGEGDIRKRLDGQNPSTDGTTKPDGGSKPAGPTTGEGGTTKPDGGSKPAGPTSGEGGTTNPDGGSKPAGPTSGEGGTTKPDGGSKPTGPTSGEGGTTKPDGGSKPTGPTSGEGGTTKPDGGSKPTGPTTGEGGTTKPDGGSKPTGPPTGDGGKTKPDGSGGGQVIPYRVLDGDGRSLLLPFVNAARISFQHRLSTADCRDHEGSEEKPTDEKPRPKGDGHPKPDGEDETGERLPKFGFNVKKFKSEAGSLIFKLESEFDVCIPARDLATAYRKLRDRFPQEINLAGESRTSYRFRPSDKACAEEKPPHGGGKNTAGGDGISPFNDPIGDGAGSLGDTAIPK